MTYRILKEGRKYLLQWKVLFFWMTSWRTFDAADAAEWYAAAQHPKRQPRSIVKEFKI